MSNIIGANEVILGKTVFDSHGRVVGKEVTGRTPRRLFIIQSARHQPKTIGGGKPRARHGVARVVDIEAENHNHVTLKTGAVVQWADDLQPPRQTATNDPAPLFDLTQYEKRTG